MTEIIRSSHSTIRGLNSCPRLLLFEKEMRLYPVTGSTAMRYGSGFHAGMEGYYRNGKDIQKALEASAAFWQKPTVQVFEDDYRNLESLLNSIMTYHEQYQHDNEIVFGVPEAKTITQILLTDEEKSYYGDIAVDFVVVIDLLLEIDSLIWVVDFKTTSVDLAYMASRLRKMPQLMGYQFTAQDNYKNITGTMVYYHQLKASKSRKTGLYGDLKTDFMKFPQIYSNSDHADWRKYVIWNAFKLQKAKQAGYPPNYNSCYEFNRQCPYLPLCDYPRWDLDKFKEMDGFVIVPDEREAVNAAQ
jgi:hypothetical protein